MNQISVALLNALIYLTMIFSWLIIINALLSWVIPDRSHPVARFISQFTEPIVLPFRKLSKRIPTGGLPIDLSPLFAILFLRVLQMILTSILFSL